MDLSSEQNPVASSSRVIQQQNVSGSIVLKPAHRKLRVGGSEITEAVSRSGTPFVGGSASSAGQTWSNTRLPGSSGGASTPPRSRSPTNVEGRVEGDVDGDAKGGDEEEELTRIRRLLRPPPIPGISDWGIPPEPDEECDAELEARIIPIPINCTCLKSRQHPSFHACRQS